MTDFACYGCKGALGNEWGTIYSNEQYYPWMEHVCAKCLEIGLTAIRRQDADIAGYEEGFRKGRSAATEAMRYQNKELKERIRITTDLLMQKDAELKEAKA